VAPAAKAMSSIRCQGQCLVQWPLVWAVAGPLGIRTHDTFEEQCLPLAMHEGCTHCASPDCIISCE